MTVPIATINQNTSASGHSNLQFRHCTNPRSVLHCIFRGSRRSLACRRAWISWFIQLCMEDEGQNLSESWRNKGIWVEITETQTCTHTHKQHIHYIHTFYCKYHTMKPCRKVQNKTKHWTYALLSALAIVFCVWSKDPKVTFDLHMEGASRSLAATHLQHSCGHTWGQLFATVHEVDTTSRALPGSSCCMWQSIFSSAWHGIFSWVLRILAVGPGSKIVATLLFALLRGMFTGCPSRFWGKQGCPYRALPCLCGWHLPWVEKRGICATRKLWKRAGAAVALSRVRVNGWSVF